MESQLVFFKFIFTLLINFFPTNYKKYTWKTMFSRPFYQYESEINLQLWVQLLNQLWIQLCCLIKYLKTWLVSMNCQVAESSEIRKTEIPLNFCDADYIKMPQMWLIHGIQCANFTVNWHRQINTDVSIPKTPMGKFLIKNFLFWHKIWYYKTCLPLKYSNLNYMVFL